MATRTWKAARPSSCGRTSLARAPRAACSSSVAVGRSCRSRRDRPVDVAEQLEQVPLDLRRAPADDRVLERVDLAVQVEERLLDADDPPAQVAEDLPPAQLVGVDCRCRMPPRTRRAAPRGCRARRPGGRGGRSARRRRTASRGRRSGRPRGRAPSRARRSPCGPRRAGCRCGSRRGRASCGRSPDACARARRRRPRRRGAAGRGGRSARARPGGRRRARAGRAAASVLWMFASTRAMSASSGAPLSSRIARGSAVPGQAAGDRVLVAEHGVVLARGDDLRDRCAVDQRQQRGLVDAGLAVAPQLGHVVLAVARQQPGLARRAARELPRLAVEGSAE